MRSSRICTPPRPNAPAYLADSLTLLNPNPSLIHKQHLGHDHHNNHHLPCDLLHHILYGTVVVGLTITLLSLTGWHVYLILHNMTTIEYYEGNRAKWLAAKTGQNYRHPYNIGAYKNITLILGPTMLKWLCPTAVSHLKEGVNFPTLRDNS
ncbi:putative S-acyltransferase [Trifolium pratense]|uniref:Putative S-acyltransferase n=1 Tax=Trifolium pratense TaxID=57577 RepID=A0A2K3PBF8_TRIPR|nr:putative S-acyltransferase [Trifolium pratense]